MAIGISPGKRHAPKKHAAPRKHVARSKDVAHKTHKKPKISHRRICPVVHVYPGECTVVEEVVHAPAMKDAGFVVFWADNDCTLSFDNTAVFGMAQVSLIDGKNKKLKVKVNQGHTSYSIVGCPTCIRFRTLLAETAEPAQGASVFSGPNDIYVP